MKLKFKKLHELAVLPKQQMAGDAGFDLVATSKANEGGLVVYGTGLAVEIPFGYVGLLFPRSSISKYNLTLANAVGVVDSNYRGEVTLKFRYADEANYSNIYTVGERIAQLLIVPLDSFEPEWATELTATERGIGGFGSTGRGAVSYPHDGLTLYMGGCI